MTIQMPYNNPYVKQSGEGYVNQYDNPIVTNNNNEYLANAQIAAASKLFVGESVAQDYARANAGFPINTFRDYSTAYDAMIAEEKQKLANTIQNDPARAGEAAAGARARVVENQRNLADETLGAYYDLVIQDPKMAEQDELTKQSAAAKLYLTTEMARIADGAGVQDWAGALLVPDMSVQVADYLNEYHGVGSFEGYINSAEYLAGVGDAYTKLPPVQQVEFLQGLAEQLPGITGNELKQIEILMGATGQSSLGDMQFNQWLDKLDAVTLGLTAGVKMGQVVAKASRASNAVKALSKAGNVDIAGVAADQVLRNPNQARKIGISAEEAAYSLDPRQTNAISEILNGAPTGVSTEVRNKLAVIDNLTEESFNTVDQGLGLGEAEKMRRKEAEIKYLSQTQNLSEVTVADETSQGFKLSYNELDADGNLKSVTKDYPYTIDDVTGTFVDKEAGFLSTIPIMKNIIGTGTKAGNDANRLLYGYEQIDFASRKMGKSLKDAFNIATKGLNKKSVEKLNYFLEKGDNASRVFSYDELVHQGIGGVKLSRKEYESYVASRRVMDNLWFAKNTQVRRDMTTLGMKDIDIGGTFFKAKPYSSVESARKAYSNMTGSSVVIPNPAGKAQSSGVVAHLTDDVLKEYYDKGYQLVRSNGRSPEDLFSSEAMGSSHWALVEGSSISELGPSVLRYRNGYVPRAYDKAHYFVKKNRFGTMDGRNVPMGQSTLRYFDNVDDAEKYVDQLELVAKESGEAFDRKDFSVLGDREMAGAELDSEAINMWGGLYSGQRTEEGLRFGLEGAEGARVSAIESMQNYMEHVATRWPMSQYRLGMEQRWMNHAKDLVPDLQGYQGGFRSSRSVVEAASIRPAAKKKLLDAFDQIEFMNRTPTLGEEQTAGALRKVVEGMARFKDPITGKQPLKPLAKYFGNLNKADPIAAARTAAFHMYLGAFNPAQFIVQGMGASIAVSMSPIHATKGLTKLPGFAILDKIVDPAARKIQMKTFSKKFGSDFEEAYTAWQKSGLYESAVISNADAYTLYKGLPITQGTLGKVAEAGTIFFKEGELVNLRTSFLTAYQKWRAIDKNAPMTEGVLKKILSDTEKYRLHMTNANKGDFQKGLLSLPTQFLQINVRYMEALIGKELTKPEKAALVLGQGAIFGAAGVPFGKSVLEGMLKTMGVDPTEMESGDQIALQRGMLGWMLNDYMDVDAAVTSRVAIGEGLTDTIQQLLAGEDTSVGELMMGPFGGVVDSSLKALSDAAFAREGVISADDLSSDDLLLLSSTLGQTLAGIPSSTRNLMKAMYLTQSGAYRDKQGNLIMSNPDPKVRDIVAQALGFGSQDVSDFWEVVIDNRALQDAKKESVDIIMRNYDQMFTAARNNDAKQQRAFELMLKTTYSMFPNPKDRDEVLQSVFDRMQNGKARVDVAVREHIEWMDSELGKEANNWVPLINKYRAERAERAENL